MLLSHPLQIASSRCFRFPACSFPGAAGRFICRIQTAEGEWAEEIPVDTSINSTSHYTTPHNSRSAILNNSLGTLKRFNVITKSRSTTGPPSPKRQTVKALLTSSEIQEQILENSAFIAPNQSHMHARHKRQFQPPHHHLTAPHPPISSPPSSPSSPPLSSPASTSPPHPSIYPSSRPPTCPQHRLPS
jgi:hypothetical protein